MAKQTRKAAHKPLPRGRTLLWVLPAAVAIVVLVAVLWSRGGDKASSGGLLEELTACQGYSRTVSGEEFDFFRGLVEDGLYDADGTADVDARTREYIGLTNAKFYLGSRLGLCDPFDYAAMLLRLEQENTIRAAKTAEGQTVYGVTSFTPESYFRYLDAELDTDLMEYLTANADEAMEREAERYFNAHPDAFRQLDSITYQVEENGGTETVTAERSLLRGLENSDGTLSDFLYSAQPGESMAYRTPEGVERRVTLVETKTQMPRFEEARISALDSWLRAEVLDDLYATVAENNPVRLEADI